MNGNSVNLKNLTLQKKIWICFLLVFFTSAIAGLVFTYGIGENQIKNVREQLENDTPRSLSSPESDSGRENNLVILFRRLQQRMFWTLGIFLLGIAAVFFFMVRTITRRLDEVAEGARKMSAGHLNVSIPVHGCDEIGKISETINDLAANLQEILLALWNHTENCLYLMDRIHENSKTNPGVPESLENTLQHMKDDLDGMQSVIKSFEFYDVHLENGKVITRNQTGKSHPKEGNH